MLPSSISILMCICFYFTNFRGKGRNPEKIFWLFGRFEDTNTIGPIVPYEIYCLLVKAGKLHLLLCFGKKRNRHKTVS